MDKLPRIPSPPSVWFRELRIAVLPFLTFAIVLGLTVVTWRSYVGPTSLVGEVEMVRNFISSPQSGRLISLNVGLLDTVTAGQPLGQIQPADPRVLASQLALGRARIGYLRDAMDARLRQQNNEIAYVQLRLDWLTQRAELATLRAQQAYFRKELERQERFQGDASGFARPNELEIAQRDHLSLQADIEERTKLVTELEQAITRLTPEEDKLNEEAPAALRSALEIEERELRILEEQLGSITLVASVDGVVSGIHRRKGENVAEGELILTLSGNHPTRVVCFIRQPISVDVRTNMTVEVRSRGRNREAAMGRVLSVGTQLEPISPQLLPRGTSSNVIEYGLPFLVSLPPGLGVLGGEAVDLVLPPE
ncbi:MAG: HlyD family efflux transporter periplasmic adaptor subunit [Verrucomicrobia bacterium]|nr:HlyD family efflux transporter periplasmic adaptor subunit [Verrucomicrobiota bacterium]